MQDYRCLVVVGAQWGDEGKGKIVDVLAADASIVARYQGGANAGHTVHVNGESFVLHQIPSGILHPGKRCLLGNGVVVDLDQFLAELDALHARGVVAEPRLGISGRAHLLLDYHKRLDQAHEALRGEERIGTTGKGIGPAYEDKVARAGVRVGDLTDVERARRLIRAGAERANTQLRALHAEPVAADALADTVIACRDRILPMLADTGREILEALTRPETLVLLEGAQGAMLDIDHGTYPFVTSSSTTAGGAATGVGIGPTVIDGVIGVVKAYTTRVGAGPLPTEMEPGLAAHLRELGSEYGATTGRPRRCGWFDAVVVRYAAQVNGLTGLAVTKLDVLDSFESLRICTAYRAGDDAHETFPHDLGVLARAEPVYETLPGWQSPTTDARSIEDLPDEARTYLDRIEALTGVPIEFVSVGTSREEIITAGPARVRRGGGPGRLR